MGNCCGPQKAYNELPDPAPAPAEAVAGPPGPLAREDERSVVLVCLDEPSDILAKRVRDKPGLEQVRIEAASLGDAGATHLARELLEGRKLRELTIAHCRVGDRGCVALAKVMQQMPLSLIDLSGNRIGPAGVSALTKAIKAGPALTLLLDENPLVGTPPHQGVAALTDLCASLSSVKAVTLGLSACGLRFDCTTSAKGRALLECVSTFKSIDLSFNGLDDACASHLAQCLVEAPLRLDLRHNPIAPAGERALVKKWKACGGEGRILALDAAPMNAPATLADVAIETFDAAGAVSAAKAPRVVVSAAKPSPAEPEAAAASPAGTDYGDDDFEGSPVTPAAPTAAAPTEAPAEPAAAAPTLQPFKAKTSLKLAKLLVTFEAGGGDLKQAFGQFDANGDGILKVEELHAALQNLGDAFAGLSSSDVDACVVDFELDGDGVVSYDEFLAFARRGCEQLAAAGWAPPASEETKEAPETSPLSALSLRVGKVLRIYEDGGNALRTAFDRFDVAKNGRLTVDELLAGLQGLGAAFEAMTRPEVEKLVIDAFDKDPDDGSTIAYPEFVAFVARARGQLDAAEA